MCLLILAKSGSTPSKKSLRRAGDANPDGFGFAIVGNNKIHTFKSMDLEDTIGNFYDMRDRFPKGNAIFHLRITTHGVTNIENCHPFQVNEDLVMGHNGMLPIKEENGKSDTHLFATEWLPQFDMADLLDTPHGVAELSKFASGSKLAFLNTGSQLAKPFYIINEHLGHWKDGVWYSNSSYKETQWYPSYSYGSYGSSYTPTKTTSMTDYEKYNIRSHWDDEDIFAEDALSTDEAEELLTDSYLARTWLNNDLMYDHIEGEWVSPDDAHEMSDLVQWECHSCHHQEIFDLLRDDVDVCLECGTCYYCDKQPDLCNCYNGFDEQ
jgi:predicted glutamine amidotransferase